MSSVLFSVMLNGVFTEMELAVCLQMTEHWKRGQNLEFIVDKMQEAIVKIEMWANKWGFRFSVGKTKIMLFTRKLGGRLN